MAVVCKMQDAHAKCSALVCRGWYFSEVACPKGSRPPPITPLCMELIIPDWDNDIGSFAALEGTTSRLSVLNLFLSPHGMCLHWITSHG